MMVAERGEMDSAELFVVAAPVDFLQRRFPELFGGGHVAPVEPFLRRLAVFFFIRHGQAVPIQGNAAEEEIGDRAGIHARDVVSPEGGLDVRPPG